jgi:hypothetical protein
VTAPADAVARGAAPGGGRFVDQGAVFAGWIGVGMAMIVAIAFELVLAIQAVVFLVAPVCGVLVGAYANQRSARWRPMLRVWLNGAYAGLLTGVSLAVLYGVIRLVFVFADFGALPDGTSLSCHSGPDCTYQRYILDGRGPELAAAGITDGASFGAYAIRDQIEGGAYIIVLTLVGAALPAAWRSLQRPPADAGNQLSGASA